jgi:hypothetical protein
MSYLAIFKRIVPFFLTFAAGLLIASIFIPITAPSFSRGERGRNRWHEYKRLKIEVEELRREKNRMKEEIEELRRDAQNWDTTNLKFVVPEINVDTPPPPPPVKRPHRPHGDR